MLHAGHGKTDIGLHTIFTAAWEANAVTQAQFAMLAGNGETDAGLHTIFKAAWEADANAPVPLYGAGQNIIPAMHVADFAAYVAAVCKCPPSQQYLLAADDSRLTQRDIVTAVAQKFGDVPVKENSLEELYFQEVNCPDHKKVCKFS